MGIFESLIESRQFFIVEDEFSLFESILTHTTDSWNKMFYFYTDFDLKVGIWLNDYFHHHQFQTKYNPLNGYKNKEERYLYN